jgi:hypothetical protein
VFERGKKGRTRSKKRRMRRRSSSSRRRSSRRRRAWRRREDVGDPREWCARGYATEEGRPRTELIAYPKNSVTSSTLPFNVISFLVPVDVAAMV